MRYSATELRFQVAERLRTSGTNFRGLDMAALRSNVESRKDQLLRFPILGNDFIFKHIADALTDLNAPGDFSTIAGVLKGLGLSGPKELMAMTAIMIGHPDHGTFISPQQAAQRLENPQLNLFN